MCSRAAHSAVHGQIGPNFEHSLDVITVLVTCKNEEERIKNEGARELTTFFIDFSDTRGKPTL